MTTLDALNFQRAQLVRDIAATHARGILTGERPGDADHLERLYTETAAILRRIELWTQNTHARSPL